jgi:hypothetical protein
LLTGSSLRRLAFSAGGKFNAPGLLGMSPELSERINQRLVYLYQLKLACKANIEEVAAQHANGDTRQP